MHFSPSTQLPINLPPMFFIALLGSSLHTVIRMIFPKFKSDHITSLLKIFGGFFLGLRKSKILKMPCEILPVPASPVSFLKLNRPFVQFLLGALLPL